MKKILITGGAGFIGSNFTRYLLNKYSQYQIVVLDALTYCGNVENFSKDIWGNPNFTFWHGDVRDQQTVENLIRNADVIVHLAAETHVDRSINDARPFINTDILGTQVLLEATRKFPLERFIYISSSEVYGQAAQIPMTEEHPINPRSPYAAAKASADRLVYAYGLTYDLPVIIIRPFNNYGPYQYPEKLIPLFITNALENKSLPVYGEGKFTRDWIYVEDHCKALDKILHTDLKKLKGEVVNLGSGKETDVMTIAKLILDYLRKPASLINHISDRPAHVQRHISSTAKAKVLLGWQVSTEFTKGLKQTIDWYLKHEEWWKTLKERWEKMRGDEDESSDYWNYRICW